MIRVFYFLHVYAQRTLVPDQTELCNQLAVFDFPLTDANLELFSFGIPQMCVYYVRKKRVIACA